MIEINYDYHCMQSIYIFNIIPYNLNMKLKIRFRFDVKKFNLKALNMLEFYLYSFFFSNYSFY
jgi:hypothetical protein